MAGGFPVGYSWGGAINGSTPSSSNGVTVTASASTNTKGSYTQLIAATSSDCSCLLVTVTRSTAGSTGFLIDISVGGAGSEIVIAPNLAYVTLTTAANITASQYLIPCSIPASSRVAARIQASTSSAALQISAICITDTMASFAPSGFMDDYGTLTATSLLSAVDAGATANTKGAYTQLTASTTRDYRGFILGIGQGTTTSSSPAGSYMFATIDVAIGGAGAEKIILGDYQVMSLVPSAALQRWNPGSSCIYPISIPAGSRIAARAQCSTNTANARIVGVSLYGVP